MRTSTLVAACAAVFLSASSASAALVFMDTFAGAAENSPLAGRTPPIGNDWAAPVGVPVVHTTVATGDLLLPYVETQGAERQIRASWPTALTAGQILTVTLPLRPSSGNFWAGNSGFSIQGADGTTTAVFAGSSSDGATGLQLQGFELAATEAAASTAFTGNSDQTQSLKLTYVYNTGLATLTVGNNVATTSGTFTSAIPITQVYIHNNGGADVRFQGLTVDISPVPEPASLGLVTVSAAGLLLRRRRATIAVA